MTYTLSETQELTPEEIAEIEAAKLIPIVYDEDCPDLTPETYAAFKRAAIERNIRLRDKTRLSEMSVRETV